MLVDFKPTKTLLSEGKRLGFYPSMDIPLSRKEQDELSENIWKSLELRIPASKEKSNSFTAEENNLDTSNKTKNSNTKT